MNRFDGVTYKFPRPRAFEVDFETTFLIYMRELAYHFAHCIEANVKGTPSHMRNEFDLDTANGYTSKRSGNPFKYIFKDLFEEVSNTGRKKLIVLRCRNLRRREKQSTHSRAAPGAEILRHV